jgi:hypothetical protein
MSSDRIHDAVLCAERRGRTPARSIDAAIVTELAYGCNCRSANGNTTTVRQSIFPGRVGIPSNHREFIMRDGAKKALGLAQVKPAVLDQLPIRKIDMNNAVEKARHDRMVALVERMLELHKQLAGARSDHAKTNLQRQIDATDAQIDKLVYELYELTPDEIKIVEDSAAV